jgi:hypothetical protein
MNKASNPKQVNENIARREKVRNFCDKWVPVAKIANAGIAAIGVLLAASYYNFTVIDAEEHRRMLEEAKITYEIGDAYKNYVQDRSCMKWCVPHIVRAAPADRNKDDVAFAGFYTYLIHTDNAVFGLLNRMEAISYYTVAYKNKNAAFSPYICSIFDIVLGENDVFIKEIRGRKGEDDIYAALYSADCRMPAKGGRGGIAFHQWVFDNAIRDFNPLPDSRCRKQCDEVAHHLGMSTGLASNEADSTRNLAGR